MKIKRKILSAVLSATLYLSAIIVPINSQIPFWFSNQENIEIVADATFDYTNADNYVADCLQKGLIDPDTGEALGQGNLVYRTGMEREYTYDKVAREVLDDKALVGLSAVWNDWSAAVSVEFSSVTHKQLYEALIMDYLAYETNSESYKSEIVLKTAKYGWDVYDELVDVVLEEDKSMTKELASKVVREMSIFSKNNANSKKEVERLNDIAKDMEIIEKLDEYVELVNGLEKVGSNAKTYYENLTKSLAIREANEERIEFLLYMKEKAKDNKDFCKAVDDIIAKIKSSYGKLSFNLGIQQMAKYAIDTAWEQIIEEIPCFSALKLGTGALDVMFNSNSTASNNFKIILLYTMEQYAKQATYSAGVDYFKSSTQENARIYVASFRHYLIYQEYATDWGRKFVSDAVFEGWVNNIKNIFSDENKQTYADYMEMYDSDIAFSKRTLGIMDNWEKIYYNYVGADDIGNTGTSLSDSNVSFDTETDEIGDYLEQYYLDDNYDSTIFENGDYRYEITSKNTCSIIGFSKNADTENITTVTIPEMVNYGKRVFIVSSIGYEAFSYCKASNISIPDTIKDIGYSAFMGSNFVSITIPESIEWLPYDALHGMHYLKEAYIYGGISEDTTSLFRDCDSIEHITLSYPCNMRCMFNYCDTHSTRSNTPPDDKKYYLVYVPYDDWYVPYSLKTVTITGGNTIPVASFNDMKSLTRVTLSDSISTIGEGAFMDCSSLEQINIPAEVKVIDYGTFQGCLSLSDITMGNKVEILKEWAFQGCTSLKNLDFLSENIIEIGDYAFDGCTGLSSIQLPQKTEKLGEDAFAGCISAKQLYFSESLKEIGVCAFQKCGFTSVHIPNTLELIGWCAFRYCNSLKNVEIEEGVESIGDEIFSHCVKLQEAEVLSEPGNAMFKACPRLKKITIPQLENRTLHSYFDNLRYDSLTYNWSASKEDDPEYYNYFKVYSEMANFYSHIYDEEKNRSVEVAKSLRTVTVKNGNSVHDNAFSYMDFLTEINLPETITQVGKNAFSNCSSLERLKLSGKITEIESSAFSGCTGMLGNCNGDSSISVNDVVYLQKYLHGKQKITKMQTILADMNYDGIVNVYDMILLKKKLINE